MVPPSKRSLRQGSKDEADAAPVAAAASRGHRNFRVATRKLSVTEPCWGHGLYFNYYTFLNTNKCLIALDFKCSYFGAASSNALVGFI